MKFSLLICALLAASSASFCQEAGKERPKAKDGEIIVIDCQKAVSYTGDRGQTITELTKPAMTLFRSDKKGGMVKGTTFTGDRGTSESKLGGGDLRKLTLNGNVRAEDPVGTITIADEAVIDLVEGIHTYTGKSIRIVIPEK